MWLDLVATTVSLAMKTEMKDVHRDAQDDRSLSLSVAVDCKWSGLMVSDREVWFCPAVELCVRCQRNPSEDSTPN